MSALNVIEKIKEDCNEKGYGRKKWWAQNLGVHQQTLSYWLNGQRRPNGVRHEQINRILGILNNDTSVWEEHLLKLYFKKIEIHEDILEAVIKTILSTETVDSRTLSFLSFIVQNSDIGDFTDDTLLRNRLGWLLEASGKKAKFAPLRSRTMPFVKAPGKLSAHKVVHYLKRIQTPLGRRWKVYDCKIEQIKESFLCQPHTTKS